MADPALTLDDLEALRKEHIGDAPAGPAPLTPEDLDTLKAQVGVPDDPNSGRAIGGRALTNLAFGLPNFLGGAINTVADLAERAGIATKAQPLVAAPNATPEARAFVERANASGGRIPDVAAGVRSAIGIPEMPANASTSQKIGEGALQVLLGGAPAAARAALVAPGALSAAGAAARSLLTDTVIPAATSMAGGAAGEAIGGEPGRFIGQAAGAFFPGAVAYPALSRLAQDRYARYTDPRAPQIAAAEQRLDLPQRYGRLATPEGQRIEAETGNVAGMNQAERAVLQNRGEQMVAQRQALPAPTPETAPYVGAAAGARAQAAQQAPYSGPAPSGSSAAQELLEQNIGPRAPVPVSDTLRLMNQMPGRYSEETLRSISPRATSLENMVTRPYQPGRETVPYEQVKDWRSNLGAAYENLPPLKGQPYGEVYPSVTGNMRQAAINQGVPGAAFDVTQGITHGEMAANELRAALDRTLGRSSATGGKNFAEYVGDLSQPGNRYEYQRASGAGTPNDIAQQMADLALTSEKSYVPPVQGGLRSTLGNLAEKGGAMVGVPAAAILHAMGLGPLATGLTAAAGAAPWAFKQARNAYLQSPAVRNAMLTGARTPPYSAPNMTDLIAAINAVQAQRQAQ